MQKGGTYNQEAAQAVRLSNVIIALVLAVYTLMIVFDVVSSTHYLNAFSALGVSLVWICVSFFYMRHKVTSRTGELVRIVIIHLLALTTFVFVTGFMQPFATLYIILLIACHLFFGRPGVLWSTTALIFVATLDAIIRASSNPDVIPHNFTAVTSIILLGYLIIHYIRTQETKRQALVHSQERERLQYDRILTIMNNLTDAAFTISDKGSILMYNAASLDLLDTNQSLKGKNIGELFKLTDQQNKPAKLLKVLADAKKASRRDDLNHTYDDGESIRLEINYAPIRSSYSLHKRRDEFGGYIVIMRDVTKQKSLEEERDEFISVVSHELRTPITIIEGTLSNLELLMKQPKAPAKRMLASTVSTAHEQVLYLAKMVNDLSTLSRAERGVADEPESINVSELLHALHTRYESDAKAQKLHLNLDLGHSLGSVNASRLYLEELLQNFITNAIKYTHEGSVTIHATRTGNTVTFAVSDTGIGISRTDQTNVFNKFYRSEDYRIRETNGTGLGLYVSTKLAHKLHTRIELKSRLNHGSTFSFSLPVE